MDTELGKPGAFHQLLQELRVLDVSSYMSFVRMDAATFEELLRMVAPYSTNSREDRHDYVVTFDVSSD